MTKKNIIRIFIILAYIVASYQFCHDLAYADKKTALIDSNLNIELFSGSTMGTTYHIKVVMQNSGETQREIKRGSLHRLIDDKLKQVNQSMSVYIPDSEISIFNKSAKGDVIEISPQFNSVMATAQQLYNITEGSWDGTVKPLVDLWGFGTSKEITSIPLAETIKAYLQTKGFNQININIKNMTLQKKNAAINIDLGSIAKGFGVDEVARLLKDEGYANFLVEIGGELFTLGEKANGEPWMVGISKPNKGGFSGKNVSIFNDIYYALPLRDKALATSGDYNRFTTIKGKTYSHIINPVTGYPVDNGVVSASVIADNCTFADGLATALMVMGHEKGINLVNTLENVECLIVVKNKDGKLRDYKSKSFPLP